LDFAKNVLPAIFTSRSTLMTDKSNYR